MAIPIQAVLAVSTKGFNVALKGAGKVLGGFVAIAKAASLALVGLTAAFTALVLRQSAIIDRIGKVSKVTGVAAETLQRFSFAAELAGVSTDQAQVALRRFSRRLGEAQKNTGELAPTLKRLGINVRDADGQFKSAEEVLFDLADAIADTENQSEALAIAFKAFDSEGAELVNVLNQGGDAMRALFNEADSLGAVLSGSAIRGVEAFNDEFTKLQTLIGGISNAFVAALAPALTEITEDLVEFLKRLASANGGFENLGEFLKNEFLDIVIKIVEVFGGVLNTIINITNRLSGLLRDIRLLEGPFLTPEMEKQQKLLEQMQRDVMMMKAIGKPLDVMFDRMDEFGLDTKLLREEFERIESSFTFLQKLNPFSDYDKELNNLMAIIEGVIDAVEIFQETTTGERIGAFNTGQLVEYLEKLKEIKPVQQENNDEVVKQLTFFEKIMALLEKMPARMQEFVDATVDFGEIFENVAKRLGTPLERLQKTLEDGLVKGVELFEDTLTDAILQGKADFSALGDHIKQVLAKALVQRFITGPILAAFGLAKGGPAKAGQPYIVGEKGPELFVPGQSGTVIPNHQLGQGGAGGTATTVNYNIQAVDAPSFQSLVARDPEFIFNVSRAGARRTPVG